MFSQISQSDGQNPREDRFFTPITKDSISKNLPKRQANSYKGDYGHVLCIGGQVGMAGSISLAGSAALASGAGLVTVATAKENFTVVHQTALEIMCLDWQDSHALSDMIADANTILIGPGLGRSDESRALFDLVLTECRSDHRLVIDADGLYHLSQLDQSQVSFPKQTVLTPHLGEWQRLTGLDSGQDDWKANQVFQKKLGATIVLKGSRTQVYTGDSMFQNTAGNPGMAVGGMGDTLAGIISGLLFQYPDFTEATKAGVFLHSYTADQIAKSAYVVMPTQVIEGLPKTMKDLQEEQ